MKWEREKLKGENFKWFLVPAICKTTHMGSVYVWWFILNKPEGLLACYKVPIYGNVCMWALVSAFCVAFHINMAKNLRNFLSWIFILLFMFKTVTEKLFSGGKIIKILPVPTSFAYVVWMKIIHTIFHLCHRIEKLSSGVCAWCSST